MGTLAEKLQKALDSKNAIKTSLETESNVLSEYASKIDDIKADRDFFKNMAITPTANGSLINVNDSADYPLQELKIFGSSTQDGDPTPDNPVEIESIDNVTIKITGNNFLNIPDCAITSKNFINKVPVFIPKGTYYFGFDTNYKCQYAFKDKSGNSNVATAYISTPTMSKITLTDDAYYLTIYTTSSSTPVPVKNIYLGYDATYESYYGEQSLTIPLDESLRGAGAYKDTICEQDGQIGVMRRIGEINIISSSPDWRASAIGGTSDKFRYYSKSIPNCASKIDASVNNINASLCDCYKLLNYGNTATVGMKGYTIFDAKIFLQDDGESAQDFNNKNLQMKFLYLLATPIFEPFSEEIQNQYRQLKSYYGTTNIFTDESADMECTYVADTQLHLAALST